MRRSDAGRGASLLVVILSLSPLLPVVSAASASDAETPGSAGPQASHTRPSLVKEVEQTLQELKDQIAQQHQLLHTAQTDRERELIQNALQFLTGEQRSFEDVREQLVGMEYDTSADTQEQQAEYESRRTDSILEQSQRFKQ